MNVIIFSKDRAMQLDAALATLARYLSFPGTPIDVSVIYAFSNAAFGAGYTKLMSSRHAAWILEENFREQVLAQLRLGPKYTMLYCDDCMLFAPVIFSGLTGDVLCYAPSLGRNATISYPVSRTQSIPQDFPKWVYRSADADFAYPWATTGHIYRTTDLYTILRDRAWGSPNTLEASMVGAQSDHPYMTAPEWSCSVCIPHNMVQSNFPNRNEGGSTKELNDAFLAGARIDPFAMDFSKVPAAHWPVPFVCKET
jgi:hypothetical protein